MALVCLQGWKLPDLMFATRRGLSDACTSIANQMGKLYESIGVIFPFDCIVCSLMTGAESP